MTEETKTEPALLPCPNPECGAEYPDSSAEITREGGDVGAFRVICYHCGTAGAGFAYSELSHEPIAEAEAARLWNLLPRKASEPAHGVPAYAEEVRKAEREIRRLAESHKADADDLAVKKPLSPEDREYLHFLTGCMHAGFLAADSIARAGAALGQGEGGKDHPLRQVLLRRAESHDRAARAASDDSWEQLCREMAAECRFIAGLLARPLPPAKEEAPAPVESEPEPEEEGLAEWNDKQAAYFEANAAMTPPDAASFEGSRVWNAEMARRHRSSAAAIEERDALREGGSGAIAAERQRQQQAEGWTPERDDEHADGSLATAALNYTAAAVLTNELGAKGYDHTPPFDTPPFDGFMGAQFTWPWNGEWWKPGDHRRMLVKAGALIAAEIDRLDRAALKKEG